MATEEELQHAADMIDKALFPNGREGAATPRRSEWEWATDEEMRAAAEQHAKDLGLPHDGRRLGLVGHPGFVDGTMLYTASEVSRMVGMPTNTIYQFIREGRGPCHRSQFGRPGAPYSLSILSTQIAEWQVIAKDYSQRKRIAPDRLYRGLITVAEAQRVYAVSSATLYKRIAESNVTVYQDGRNLSVKWLKESELEKAFGPREIPRKNQSENEQTH